jgi:hypothetical protein
MSVPLTEQVMQGPSAPAVHDPCRTRDSKGFRGPTPLREVGWRKGGRRVWLGTVHAPGLKPVARSVPPWAPPQAAELGERPPSAFFVGPHVRAQVGLGDSTDEAADAQPRVPDGAIGVVGHGGRVRVLLLTGQQPEKNTGGHHKYLAGRA